ncbi:hypothetical protein LZ31DRAFT_185332 [Colletotrichum somersetense]|nr:hypothetical protein LZ31DRAFT_185332 [Colletotrichum somersetense]
MAWTLWASDARSHWLCQSRLSHGAIGLPQPGVSGPLKRPLPLLPIEDRHDIQAAAGGVSCERIRRGKKVAVVCSGVGRGLTADGPVAKTLFNVASTKARMWLTSRQDRQEGLKNGLINSVRRDCTRCLPLINSRLRAILTSRASDKIER